MMHATSMNTLNIIGAGRAGRTLAALWRRRGVFDIQCVMNRTAAGTREAVAFIGAGGACERVQALQPASVWLIATPDGEITTVGQALATSGVLRAGDTVFQLSGATPSSELRAVLPAAVFVASVHPLKSFADPATAVANFAGTWCVMEGMPAVLAVLQPAFEQIGARVTQIDAHHKTLYHAASVMACNYLTALMEAGLQCFDKASLPRATASAMMEPLVRDTLDNVFKLGTMNALTGPIARGDHAVVARQLDALQAADAPLAEVYRALGVVAVELSRQQGGASEAALTIVRDLLQPPRNL